MLRDWNSLTKPPSPSSSSSHQQQVPSQSTPPTTFLFVTTTTSTPLYSNFLFFKAAKQQLLGLYFGTKRKQLIKKQCNQRDTCFLPRGYWWDSEYIQKNRKRRSWFVLLYFELQKVCFFFFLFFFLFSVCLCVREKNLGERWDFSLWVVLGSVYFPSRRIFLGDRRFFVPHKTHNCDWFSGIFHFSFYFIFIVNYYIFCLTLVWSSSIFLLFWYKIC